MLLLFLLLLSLLFYSFQRVTSQSIKWRNLSCMLSSFAYLQINSVFCCVLTEASVSWRVHATTFYTSCRNSHTRLRPTATCVSFVFTCITVLFSPVVLCCFYLYHCVLCGQVVVAGCHKACAHGVECCIIDPSVMCVDEVRRTRVDRTVIMCYICMLHLFWDAFLSSQSLILIRQKGLGLV